MTVDSLARNSVIVLILGGLAVIGTAWGFQIIGGYVPCKLCLEQRLPYYAGLPLAAAGLLLLLRGRDGLALSVLLAVAAIFAYGAGLGIYQAGAEWQFWDGPNDCGGGSAAPASAANMLQALQSTRIVSCTEASWRMFGLSFAGWNAVASAGLAGLALLAAVLLKQGKRNGSEGA
ncbi:disulfide bond formation protein B [Roseibium denhamense]|uniref:Disulfide bond formation protein DsbB n=1 Tax=Roseibium denhamense TaxID=76305 RepID=A0ABY1P9P3_9HYPH|nr:disulfide bond formation protein B [Roseibium denhamense]MTI07412.1 disulfide bond formation protein B [Roseibium denhamense]SMP29414.1 Disulfide bond formation protein DsbB [Roseibium denhamense]